MVVVLVVAAGAAWESPVLELVAARPGLVVLKRCVDVDDLLAAGSAGQADAALVALDAPGLDQAAVDLLHRHQVRVVARSPAASPDAARAAGRPGRRRRAWSADDDLPRLLDLLECRRRAAVVPTTRWRRPSRRADRGAAGSSSSGVRPAHRVGPPSRPGSPPTLAGRGLRTTLVDADPYAGVGRPAARRARRGLRPAQCRPADRRRRAGGAASAPCSGRWATT